MDINCTHACFYQQDGKCNLRELPAFSNNTFTAYDVDCPHFHEAPKTSMGPFS
ncbi:MAG: hypothetical protein FWC92_10925 [Defluviitaleaceae bacterium]|nr:hypothetical protein [Defluviitaleaceae bacterium]